MSRVRLLVGWVAGLSILVGVVGRSPDAPVLLASESRAFALNLHFTSFATLSAGSRAALMTEAESIWKAGHVRLKWLRESTEADEGPILRVVVLARPASSRAENSPWAVAELMRPEGAAPLAIASTIGARRVVDEGRWEFSLEPAPVRDHRFGLVLGRALAHEIGHYLLQTNTHARQGLMRATIDVREFGDLRSGPFRLDQAAEAYMAIIAANGALLSGARPFSYSR